MVSQQNKCNIKKFLSTQIHRIRHTSLKETNNIDQTNQFRISVYIQYNISPETSLIEHLHSNELASAYFE